MRIYFANDLFNDATRMYNEYVVRQIETTFGNDVSVYLPQRNDAINDKTAYADSIMIAQADYAELKESDLLVAIIDNGDTGVALEVGIAYEAGIPIIGLYTDTRQQGADNIKKLEALKEIGENQFAYVNLMLSGVIKSNGELVDNIHQLLLEIESMGSI